MNKWLILGACVCTSYLFAGETVLYKSDFAKNKNLAEWFGDGNSYRQGVPYNKPPKAPTNATVVEKDGTAFLQIKKGFYGVTIPFANPVSINDSLQKVSLKMVIRQEGKEYAMVKEIALTSRKQPSGTNGSPYWKGRDSGISVRGYIYSNQAANILYWRKEGMDYRKSKSNAPFNLFPKTVHTQWTTLTMVFDSVAKTVTYTCGDEKPFVMRNVELQGTELNSLYICSLLDVKEIEVTCTTK